MEELKKALIKKINQTTDEALLEEIEGLLNQHLEIKKLENFVVESRIDELEDDEFLTRDDAVERAANSLKPHRAPYKS